MRRVCRFLSRKRRQLKLTNRRIGRNNNMHLSSVCKVWSLLKSKTSHHITTSSPAEVLTIGSWNPGQKIWNLSVDSFSRNCPHIAYIAVCFSLSMVSNLCREKKKYALRDRLGQWSTRVKFFCRIFDRNPYPQELSRREACIVVKPILTIHNLEEISLMSWAMLVLNWATSFLSWKADLDPLGYLCSAVLETAV